MPTPTYALVAAALCQLSPAPSTTQPVGPDLLGAPVPFHGRTVDRSIDPWPGPDEQSGFERLVGLGDLGAVNENIRQGRLVTLHAAAQLGLQEYVRRACRDRPAGINATVNGLTPLAAACISGQLATARLLLDLNADPNAGFGNRKPIFMAAENGHPEILQLLLDHGARPPATEDAARALLIMAAQSKSVECLRIVLSSMPVLPKAEVVASDVLPVAAGSPEMVRIIVGGLKPALLGPALFSSVVSGNLEAANLLLSHGAPVDWAAEDGRTALFVAVESDNTALINTLLDHGADAGHKAADGETPLGLAKSLRYNAAAIALGTD